MASVWAVVPAAGRGTRFGGEVPKQYLQVGGRPLLAYTLDALLGRIGAALAADTSLGGLAENLHTSAPEVSVFAIEGAAPILAARIAVTVEYLVSDPLTA